jgi:hypothetical protein
MNSATAVIIGALVAFVGSILGSVAGPWVRARFDRRLCFADDKRSEQRRIIVELLHVETSLGLEQADHNQRDSRKRLVASMTRLIGELGLWLDEDDIDVAFVFQDLFSRIADKDAGVRQVAGSRVVGRWFRSEIPGNEVRQAYLDMVDKLNANVASIRSSRGD